MKKTVSVLLSLLFVILLSACGSKNETPADQTASQNEVTAAVQDGTSAAAVPEAENADVTAADVEEPVIPGVLYQLNKDENEEPVIRAIALDGNLAGSYRGPDGDSVNGKEPSTDDIRFVFELNEWISIIPDSDKTEGLSVYLVKHQEDEQTYADSFISALTDEVANAGLVKPEDTDGYGYWGELCANPDAYQPGHYDLVFTDGMKPVAKITLRLYAEGELSGKTDAELAQLMSAEAHPENG